MRASANLLPGEFRFAMALRRCLTQWSVVWVLSAGLAGTAVYQHKYVPYLALEARRETSERQYHLVAQLESEIRAMQAEVSQLEAREAMVLELAGQWPPLAVIGCVGRSGRPAGDEAYLKELSYQRQERPADENSSAGKAGPIVVTLQGAATQIVAAMQWVAGLRDSGLFESVDLKSTETELVDDQERVAYVVQCTVKGK